MFKVVPDQLKVSDGWVRCGHCDGVFDASAHFQAIVEPHLPGPDFMAEDAPADFVPPIAAATSRAVVDDASISDANELPNEADSQLYQASSLTPSDVSDAPRFTAQSHIDDASVSAPLSNYLSAPEAADFPFPEDHGRSQDASDRRALYGSAASNKPASSLKTDDVRRPVLPEVTFVQSAKRREKFKGPFYTVLAVLMTLVLLAALALQVLLHERDALAARYPALLPAMTVMCEQMDCQINPPRVIEAITIDSSSFTQVGPDAYRLNVVLKNTRSAAVAMPALEVTLTGSQNEVLLRRVLLPTEFGALNSRLEKAVPFAGGFTLLVRQPLVSAQPSPAASSVEAVPAEVTPEAHSPVASVPITGYRLFAFYP